ncbi:MAG: pilus assembly protein PilM [Victivallales bacterium]|nr:pilus assembly protein PilM [Victivallales bacterium]
MKFRIGIDLGASATKIAVFSGSGKKAQLVGFHKLESDVEGILSEAELYAAIKELLDEKKLPYSELAWAIPQFAVTAKIADYPPKISDTELSRLVAMETRQVDGISDEAFLHGYAVMPGGHGRQKPVLIAMSREDMIREKLTSLEDHGLSNACMAPAGMALAAAATSLVDGLASEASPVMLLDIGKDNTTVVMMAGGQVLYLGTLMFNAGNFESAAKGVINGRPGFKHESVHEYLAGIKLKDESTQSPILKAAFVLESELQGAVEHWRSQENDELAAMPVVKVYMCGGGSRLGGLCEWLSGILECDVMQFGPRNGYEMQPELTVAYGLGLMACNQTPYRLFLMPQDMAQMRQRLRRWPFAAAAVALFFTVLFGWMMRGYLDHVDKITELEEQNELLGQCLVVARQREDVLFDVIKYDGEVSHLAAPAARGMRLERALSLISSTKMSNGWLIYLADEVSASTTRDASGNFLFENGGSSNKTSAVQTMSLKSVFADKEFICSGFIPVDHKDEVSSFMELLNSDNGLFANTDRADSLEDTNPNLVQKWREFLNRNEKRLTKALKLKVDKSSRTFSNQFELFTLRLPVATSDFMVPVGKDAADEPTRTTREKSRKK